LIGSEVDHVNAADHSRGRLCGGLNSLAGEGGTGVRC